MKLGDSRERSNPDGYSEGAFGWNNANLLTVSGAADSWFAQYGLKPISDCIPVSTRPLANEVNWLEQLAPFYFGDEPDLLLPELERDFESFGSQIPLEESELGRLLISTLEKHGVTWSYNNRVVINHFDSIEVETNTEGFGQWGSYFGMPIHERFMVFRDGSGKETITWSMRALVATREYRHVTERNFLDGNLVVNELMPDDYLARGGLTFGDFADKVFVPLFAKKLFFLAETPFPSTTLFTMPRSTTFADFAEIEMPVPFINFERRGSATSVYAETTSGFQGSTSIFPTVVNMGWHFSNADPTQLEKIVTVVADGLVKIATILEDGYLNFRSADYPSPYDHVLLSACVFDRSYADGDSVLGHSQWVPTQRFGLLHLETRERFAAALETTDPKLQRSELWWCVDNGVGPEVGSAANNLAWYFFMKELNDDPQTLVAAERQLEQVILLDIFEESTNAMSNLGILHYMAHNLDRATELFELALERSDHRSDDEAHFYLALICELRGEDTAAEQHRTACADLGGYEYPPQRQVDISTRGQAGTEAAQDAPASTSTVGAAAKFCPQCGNKFGSLADIFCANCGVAR